MKRNEEAGQKHRTRRPRPWGTALVYGACFVAGFASFMVILVLLNPTVYSIKFFMTSLLAFALPIGVVIALFVIILKWFRCGKGATAIITLAVLSAATELVIFLSFPPSDDSHLPTYIMLSIFMSLPVIFGIGVASLFGYLYDERREEMGHR